MGIKKKWWDQKLMAYFNKYNQWLSVKAILCAYTFKINRVKNCHNNKKHCVCVGGRKGEEVFNGC